jgi:excisionase family DNA binding protein
MPKTKTKPKKAKKPAITTNGEVLTLAEAAAYLRVTEDDVRRMMHEQDLPARRVGACSDEWRFLKSALQEWLRSPPKRKEAILGLIGAFKDDPDLEEIVKEAYRRRGRPMTEEG